MDLPFLFQLFYYSRVNANLLNSVFLSLVSFNGPHSTLNENLYSWGSRKKEKFILMMIFFFYEMNDLYNIVSVFSHPVSLKFLWLAVAGLSFLYSVAFKHTLPLFNNIFKCAFNCTHFNQKWSQSEWGWMPENCMGTLLPAVAVSVPDGTGGPTGHWIPVNTAGGIQHSGHL